MPQSAEVRARAKATREANLAKQPLYVLAKILNERPATLRARLDYHKQPISGASLADLVQTIREKTRSDLTATQLRKIEEALQTQVVVEDTGQERETVPEKSPENPESLAPRVRRALIALKRLKKIVLPKIGADNYGPLELGILEVLELLEPRG